MESKKAGADGFRPHPYAIRTASKSVWPETYEQALEHVDDALDIGWMQINTNEHGDEVDGVIEHLLDPHVNIVIGAKILRESIDSYPTDLATGVGRYNAWGNLKKAKAYGTKVLALATALKEMQ